MKVLTCLVLLVAPCLSEVSLEKYAQQLDALSQNTTVLKMYETFIDKRTKLHNEKLYPAGNSVFGEPLFNCESMGTHSRLSPVSVHSLMPGDINVVAALGDSSTAAVGAGAMSLEEMSLEYRGMSFAAGSDSDLRYMVTVPNVLKRFNSMLVGGSKKVSPVWFEYFSQFNVAVTGSGAQNLTEQAVELVRRMKDHANVDYANDWKMINIFIGNLELCRGCMDKTTKYLPSTYGEYLKSTLQYIKTNIPRSFVNVVDNVHVDILASIKDPYCDIMHQNECPCAKSGAIDSLTATFQQTTKSVVDGFKDGSNDFVVVLHPWFGNKDILPKTSNGDPDASYLAPDCFHFSQIGHAYAARNYWNSLVSSEQDRQTSTTTTNGLKCPDKECPLLRTYKNSADCATYFDPRNVVKGDYETLTVQPTPLIDGALTSLNSKADVGSYNKKVAEKVPTIELRIPADMQFEVKEELASGSKFGWTTLGLGLGVLLCALAFMAWYRKQAPMLERARLITERTPLMSDDRLVKNF